MSDIGGVLILFLPIAIVLFFANLGERSRRATLDPNAHADAGVNAGVSAGASAGDSAGGSAGINAGVDAWSIFTYVLLIGIYGALILVGVGFAMLQLLSVQAPLSEANLAMRLSNAPLFSLGFILPSIAGLILLLPAVRRLCARLMPIDPANRVHAVALSMSMLVLINMVVTLGVGLDTLSEMVSAAEEQSGQSAVSLASVWVQQIAMAFLGFVGVGWIVRRSGSETLQRLGLVLPTGRQILIGVGVALILVSAVLAIQALASVLGFESNTDVEKLSEQLLGPLFSSPIGILTLGLSAALGEETLMRGAAQPRLGLIYTSFLFSLLHSNYGITMSTWVVFGVGLVLGIVRIRFNTSTSMVVHATYNMLLGLMAYLSIDFLQGR